MLSCFFTNSSSVNPLKQVVGAAVEIGGTVFFPKSFIQIDCVYVRTLGNAGLAE